MALIPNHEKVIQFANRDETSYDQITDLKEHTKHATDVAYSPMYNHIATASANGITRCWNDQGSLLKTSEGHLDYIICIAFHPSGKYLGTASFDKTWRLWDIEI